MYNAVSSLFPANIYLFKVNNINIRKKEVKYIQS